ncbi:MAG TPA: FMN-binding negative transcriptional regulator [Ktedonobacteraceae bacterium]|nr:FMN-binding negative transcriptional regulator [Ktedonobacteraceae bacterium]
MYTPKHFREDDLAVLHTLMRDYSFATLVSAQEDGVPVATQLPFVFEPEPAPYGTLKAHMALANPQWHTFSEERDVLVIFQGPHAYISPSWYEVELSVPTWNYATVHAYGKPRIFTDQADLYAHLKTLIATHEAQFAEPWPFQLPRDYTERLMKGVVAFSLEITRIEGKFKMSQNRSENERARVSAELRASRNSTLCEVAELVSGTRKK